MGMEDYGVILKPTTVEIPVRVIRRTLTAMGFHREPSTLDYGPAQLGALARNETAYTLDDGEHVVELLLRYTASGADAAHPEPLRRLWQKVSERLQTDAGNEAHVISISLRYAVCQPEVVVRKFLTVVAVLSEEFQMTILQGREEFEPGRFEEFRVLAEEQIRRQKKMWSNLFEGDTEELRMPVGEAWAYFLRKHPHLRASPPAVMDKKEEPSIVTPPVFQPQETEQNQHLYRKE